jgi:hypothetical protein
MLSKQSILQIRNVYTAHAFPSGESVFVGAGSETEPVVQLTDLATGKIEHLPDSPGGMMSFIPFPRHTGTYVSIMGLFPPFIGKETGLYLHRRSSDGWKTTRVMDLPFLHRCEFLPSGKHTLLVAATVSKHKENPADWSRPGEVHLVNPGDPVTEKWKSTILDSEITRNHGMTRARIDGKEKICISGAEGIFCLSMMGDGTPEIIPLFRKEVSEMTFIDLDGDGNQEMVTVEPFHGNTLNIYKRAGKEWSLKFSDSLSFGHGLSSGIFNGKPIIVAGNRSESLALETFTVDDLNKGSVKRIVIEENAGPTQTQVFSFKGRDYILSANQRKHEVALYSGS